MTFQWISKLPAFRRIITLDIASEVRRLCPWLDTRLCHHDAPRGTQNFVQCESYTTLSEG